MRNFVLLVIVAIFFCLGDRRAYAVVLSGYSEPLHERFANDPSFIGAAYDFSGLSRAYSSTGTPIGRHATMISETLFISANHWHPEPGHQLQFFASNDNTNLSPTNFWQGTVTTGAQVGNSDIWLGRVLGNQQEAPPSWVRRYPLLERQDGTNWASYLDPKVVHAGRSSGQPYDNTGLRVGFNDVALTGFNYTSGAGSQGITFETAFDTNPGTGYGVDEARLEPGDSGSTTFAESSSGLSVLGPHWYFDPQTLDSGVSSAGAFREAIVAIAGIAGEQVSFLTDLRGDLDGDFRVGLGDLDILGSNMGEQVSSYNDGDIDMNGVVDLLDLDLLGANWGLSLFAPSDFNEDELVDNGDLQVIADHILQPVTPTEDGDATGDGLVNRSDVLEWGENRPTNGIVQYYIFNGYPEPVAPRPGDVNKDGQTNLEDQSIVVGNMGETVPPGTNGDLNGDAVVDLLDLDIVSAGYGNLFGDVNGDQVVNILDVDEMILNLGPTSSGHNVGDVNLDGVVDGDDIVAVGDYWHVEWDVFRAPGGLSNTVPEPTSLTLSMGTLLSLLMIRQVCRL